jgi:hypothetical protein
MGNEYHTLCCGLSGDMYAIELVEGKDQRQLQPANYLEHGKTTGLLLRLTESIAHSGRVVIMDSEFSVLKKLIKLASVGVFASAVIKNRRYWPTYIDGGAIDSHFEVKDIGTTDSLPGLMDGEQFRIYCMKEEDYGHLRCIAAD